MCSRMLTGLRVLHARFGLLAWLLRSYAAAAHSKALMRRDGLDTVRRHASIDTYHTPPAVDLDLEEDPWVDYDVGDIDFLGTGSNGSAPEPPPPPNGDDGDASDNDDEVALSARPVDWVVSNCSVINNALVPKFSDKEMNCAAYHAKGKPADKLNAAKAEYYGNSTGDMLSGLCMRNFSGNLKEILYGIRMSGSEVYVYKFGAQVNSKAADGRYKAGDSFHIQLANDKVNYYHNGKMLYSTAETTNNNLIPCVTYRHNRETMYTSDKYMEGGLYPCVSFCGFSLGSAAITWGITTTSTTTIPLIKPVTWDVLTNIAVKQSSGLLGDRAEDCWVGGARADSQDTLSLNAGEGEFNTFQFSVNISGGPVIAGLCPLNYTTGRTFVRHAFFLVAGTVFIWDSNGLIRAHSFLANSSSWDVFGTGDIFEVILMEGNVSYKFIKTVLHTHRLGNASNLPSSDWPLVPCATMCSGGHILAPKVRKKSTIREE